MNQPTLFSAGFEAHFAEEKAISKNVFGSILVVRLPVCNQLWI